MADRAGRDRRIPLAAEKTAKLFGRRKGKALSARQQQLIDRLLPQTLLDLGRPPASDLSELFASPVDRIFLEIGFGGGEHLTGLAAEYPKIGFVGIEPFINGLAKCLTQIDALKLANIRLFDGDAALVLDWLPPASIDRIYLLYPDPWPKKRHWKRRFVNTDNLAAMSRVLKPGGQLRFASDIAHYVNWTLRHAAAQPSVRWTALAGDDWRKPWPDWTETRYEAKARREGRMPTYLIFEKTHQDVSLAS